MITVIYRVRPSRSERSSLKVILVQVLLLAQKQMCLLSSWGLNNTSLNAREKNYIVNNYRDFNQAYLCGDCNTVNVSTQAHTGRGDMLCVTLLPLY